MKSRLVLASLVVMFLAVPSHLFAAQEFTTNLHATYIVNSTGTTTVSNEIHIKNNFSSIYAKQYALQVSSNRVANVLVTDSAGNSMNPDVTQTDAKTNIALVFPNKVIGKDQERVFTIRYDQPDVSMLAGTVLEVDVPKLTSPDEFAEYNVTIQVPQQFGDPAISNPSYAIQHTDLATVLNYVNAKNGINVLFGQKQSYAFQLRYHVNNPSISQGISQIALPPDTPYQKMFYTSLTPQPDKIERDADGNWIATYTIGSQKEVEIDAQGYVNVYLKPTVQLSTTPQKIDKQYTTAQQFWELADPTIQSLAQKYRTPKAIYDYLVSGFTYNYDRLSQTTQQRMGAAQAVKNPTQALCEEFTDTFVAIARAQNISAREVNGYAYTDNSRLRPLSLVADVLHAWPEYYDPQQRLWIPIDPTWGNTTGGVDYFTKLDFNHITFAIHGLSSTKPFPAGVYKLPGQTGKDINVQVANDVPNEISDLDIKLQQDPSSKLGFSSKATLVVTNNSGLAWYDIPVNLEVPGGFAIAKETQRQIDAILPYQTLEVPIVLNSANALASEHGTVQVEVEGKTLNYEATITQNLVPIYLGIGIGAVIILAGGVLVLKKRR
ncbi:MAG TPA: transglutaminase domain-containing protein [Candidatus Saccharimonadia bacterium]|nr:transglutaminase domain-containing protein [Candidatus Saccharimonadia bacterium]